jgi:hypothetical protein
MFETTKSIVSKGDLEVLKSRFAPQRDRGVLRLSVRLAVLASFIRVYI